MLYTFSDRLAYGRYKANGLLDEVERKSGTRLPDETRAAFLSAAEHAIRIAILDVTEYERENRP